MGLGGEMTPGGAAGIPVPDRDKWTALIQHARLSAIPACRNDRRR